jgi:hypothetical protein
MIHQSHNARECAAGLVEPLAPFVPRRIYVPESEGITLPKNGWAISKT